MRLTILHTNDIHGRQERISRIATLVREEKARAEHHVLYLDAGDVEDTTSLLSNVTKGVAMHRLLGRASCDAATVGNAAWLRYGVRVLADHARASTYPHLLANLAPVSGPVPCARFGEVGVFGLSAPFRGFFEDIHWGIERLDELEVARGVSRRLRAEGASLVVLLSHLGLDVPAARWDDRRIAAELQAEVDVIVGGHSHDLLPEGERVGRVLIAQAGELGDHLGRVEVAGDAVEASLRSVGEDVEPHPDVEAEIRRIAAEVEDGLAETVGVLEEPADAAWVAEMLRVRLRADVGLFPEGLVDGTLEPGPITRHALWGFSPSANNPGVTEMTGRLLGDLLRRADDSAFAAERPQPLRGRARGRLHVAGLDPDRIDPDGVYRVAGSDWVLDGYGGYARKEWGLRVRYEFPLTVRDAIEEHLARR